jgi:oligosaccharide repeat unit polymerase
VLILTTCMAVGVLLSWRRGGPVLAAMMAWLICTFPVASGLIEYDYLQYADNRYVILIGASILAYLFGARMAAIGNDAPPILPRSEAEWDSDLREWAPVARVCLAIAAVSVGCLLASIWELGSALNDLGSLRSDLIEATSASLLAKVASVTTWACFFCLAFAVYFRDRLPVGRLLLYVAASSGVFLSALSQAGRQSVFQAILLTLVIESLRSYRTHRTAWRQRIPLKYVITISGGVFLSFVTMERTTGVAGAGKADLFLYFFNARPSPSLEAGLLYLNESLRDIVVEALLYISHTVPLFSRLLMIDFGRHFYGMLDFPFLMRQFEPLFGYSTIGALQTKELALNADKVIGVGWTTAFSSQLMDFGLIGALLFQAGQGYLSERAFRSVRRGGGFGVVLVLVLAIVAAVYLPYLPAFSDTNLILLLLFVVGVEFLKRAQARRRAFRNWRPVPPAVETPGQPEPCSDT